MYDFASKLLFICRRSEESKGGETMKEVLQVLQLA